MATRPRPEPQPRQREPDERAALREALSDEVDVESLLLTDDGLSFRRPGLAADVVTRLRRGQWSIQAQLDLHGLRRDEAREQLAAFVREALQRGQRCVRVVHGKGHGSPGREPVLKAKVQRWLAQCKRGHRLRAGQRAAGRRRRAGGAAGAPQRGALISPSSRVATAATASAAGEPGSDSSSSWRRSTESRTAMSSGTWPSRSSRTGVASAGVDEAVHHLLQLQAHGAAFAVAARLVDHQLHRAARLRRGQHLDGGVGIGHRGRLGRHHHQHLVGQRHRVQHHVGDAGAGVQDHVVVARRHRRR